VTQSHDDPGEDPPAVVPIEDTLDLHSFQPRDVASVVEEYLAQAVLRGFRELRIIHGRGIGVQREIVHSILRRDPRVLAFRDAPDRGATLVTLATAK
jgi:dsDNA-specific endonuclease/ATPase MutS2